MIMESGIITPLFAQADLSSVPDHFWKNFCISLIVIIVVVALVVGIWAVFRKPAPTQFEQPISTTVEGDVSVKKTAKRYNHDLTEQRYTDHERRILKLEGEQAELLAKLDSDKEEILKAGQEREERLQDQITALPGKITADLLNARRLFGDQR